MRAHRAAAAQTDTSQPTATAAAEPRIAVDQRRLDVRAGKRTAVEGTVAPGVTGITVSLQVKRDGRWKPIDRDRTDAARPLHAARAPPRTGSTQRPRPRGRRRPAWPRASA